MAGAAAAGGIEPRVTPDGGVELDADALVACTLGRIDAGARHDLLVQSPRLLDAIRSGRHQDHGVEIAVADMADDRRGESGGFDILLGADDQVENNIFVGLRWDFARPTPTP